VYYARPEAPVRPVIVVRKGGALTGIFIALISLVAVGGGLASTLIPQLTASHVADLGGVVSNAQSLGRALASGSWSSGDPGCMIDANGDGVLDMAGLTGPSDTNSPTVVDGKTGTVLFSAPDSGKVAQLACVGRDGFFAVKASFQVDFYTARRPWGVTHVMARDKVSEFGVGTNCVQLKTDDGSTQGIQLPSGMAGACSVSGMHRYYSANKLGIMGLTDHQTELALGSRKYVLTQRQSGTEILTVTITEGTRPVWSKELPYASCTFGAGIAVAAGKIVLWAAHPADRDKGLIVGLDEATGNQLYEVAVPDTSSDSPEFFQFNGQYVLAVNWGALRAYEPSTGKEVWRVGR